MAHEPGDEIYIPTVFARQPVFDRAEQVWGYELFYRATPEAEQAVMDDAHLATLTVAANAFAQPGKEAVITSYSIHYTKLYDRRSRA